MFHRCSPTVVKELVAASSSYCTMNASLVDHNIPVNRFEDALGNFLLSAASSNVGEASQEATQIRKRVQLLVYGTSSDQIDRHRTNATCAGFS